MSESWWLQECHLLGCEIRSPPVLNIKPGTGALSDELLTFTERTLGPLEQIFLSALRNNS